MTNVRHVIHTVEILPPLVIVEVLHPSADNLERLPVREAQRGAEMRLP
jgi:hypothetical protein